MKALKKIVCIVGIPVILSFSLCGCGKYRSYSLKPDDSISHAVCDAVGEDLNYHGKAKINGRLQYEYEFYELDKLEVETIPEFVKAINSALGDEQEQIDVIIVVTMLSGKSEIVCSLSNYSGDNPEKADYDGLRSLWIYSQPDELHFPDSLTYYTGIEGIRKLKVAAQMQQRAEEEGIDWYECWPELEEFQGRSVPRGI